MSDGEIRFKYSPSLRYRWGALITLDGGNSIQTIGWTMTKGNAAKLADRAAVPGNGIVFIARLEWFHGNRLW